jgi:hypothetical protein
VPMFVFDFCRKWNWRCWQSTVLYCRNLHHGEGFEMIFRSKYRKFQHHFIFFFFLYLQFTKSDWIYSGCTVFFEVWCFTVTEVKVGKKLKKMQPLRLQAQFVIRKYKENYAFSLFCNILFTSIFTKLL